MNVNVQQVTGSSPNITQGAGRSVSVDVQSPVEANIQQVTGSSAGITQGAASAVSIQAFAPSLYTSLFVSVLDSRFGAKGDGVTDDNVALQACADYCANTGRIMYFPYTGAKYLTSRQ